ncbi:hypothetical protein ACFFMN_14500 [Planobispora siamensis]|uniref:DUF2092 domain-containing protein n=1 Tax=Planobispora siamensis TaxID=936338 RepID=A0A8J3S8P3_9ACTN|nr:hypothetical protein [Planobispora siamensis]GIH89423.1 hypothetical protein Psi01_00530 [Planobispora siamensis]
MKRWLALAATTVVASAAAIALPAAAQAAPAADPVQAVKRQFKAGHGVEIHEVSRLTDKDSSLGIRLNGDLQFGSTGPVASDYALTWVLDPKTRKQLDKLSTDGESFTAAVFAPQRVVIADKRAYFSGEAYNGRLPEGKAWVRLKEKVPTPNLSSQGIDVFNPAVLKTVLKTSTGKPSAGGPQYQGVVTYAELLKARGEAALLPKLGKQFAQRTVSWRLWTDDKGLPQRLRTTETTRAGKSSEVTTTDTRYTNWGAPMSIIAPPADQVIDDKDLTFGIPDPKEALNTLSARQDD